VFGLVGPAACGGATALKATFFVVRELASAGTLQSDGRRWGPADVPRDFETIAGAPISASACDCPYQYAAGVDFHEILRCETSEGDFGATAAAAGTTPWTEDGAFADVPT
jgi:hypothetical protein